MYNNKVDVMSKDPSNRSLEQLLLDSDSRQTQQLEFKCFVQLPKFNTNIVVGDKVIINEGRGTVLFIKENELTLSCNGLRWTLYVNDIQTFSRFE